MGPVSLRLAAGRADIGPVSVPVAVGEGGGLRVGGPGGPLVRPLRFGERARLVRYALTTSDPVVDVTVAVRALATGGTSPPETATLCAAVEVLALHLAGAGSGAPGFATVTALVTGVLGWGSDALAGAEAAEVDSLARLIAEAAETDDWQRVIFDTAVTAGGDGGLEAVRDQLAADLLRRGQEPPAFPAGTGPRAAGGTVEDGRNGRRPVWTDDPLPGNLADRGTVAGEPSPTWNAGWTVGSEAASWGSDGPAARQPSSGAGGRRASPGSPPDAGAAGPGRPGSPGPPPDPGAAGPGRPGSPARRRASAGPASVPAGDRWLAPDPGSGGPRGTGLTGPVPIGDWPLAPSPRSTPDALPGSRPPDDAFGGVAPSSAWAAWAADHLSTDGQGSGGGPGRSPQGRGWPSAGAGPEAWADAIDPGGHRQWSTWPVMERPDPGPAVTASALEPEGLSAGQLAEAIGAELHRAADLRGIDG